MVNTPTMWQGQGLLIEKMALCFFLFPFDHVIRENDFYGIGDLAYQKESFFGTSFE